MYHFTNIMLALTIPVWLPLGLTIFVLRAAWYFAENMHKSTPS